MSNMKQLALSCMMYAQDYDDRLPIGRRLDTVWSGGVGWAALDPYIKNSQVLYCPSGTVSSSTSRQQNYGIFAGYTGRNTADSIMLSYYTGSGGSTSYPQPLDGIPFPSQTAMIGETGQAGTSPKTADNNPAGCTGTWHFDPNSKGGQAVIDVYSDCSPWGNLYMGRHFDGSNFAYLDGHVKWIKTSAILATYAAQQATGKGIPQSDAGKYPVVFVWSK